MAERNSTSRLIHIRDALQSEAENAVLCNSLLDVGAHAKRVLDAAVIAQELTASQAIRLNVGGVRYDTTASTLKRSEYFSVLLRCANGTTGNIALAVDRDGALLVDRRGEAFKHVLAVLRGADYLHSVPSEALHELINDLEYFGIPIPKELHPRVTEKTSPFDFRPGPAVHPQALELRTISVMGAIDQDYMMCGRHFVTFEVIDGTYLGLGIASNLAFDDFVPEPHRTPGCIMFYMSGAFFVNDPAPSRHTDTYSFVPGSRVTLLADMTERTFEVLLDGVSLKVFSIRDHSFSRIRFVAVVKHTGKVRLIDQE